MEESKLNTAVIFCLAYRRPWRWSRYIPEKRRLTSAELLGVTIKTIALFDVIPLEKKPINFDIAKRLFEYYALF
jgi:hypothetical protein